MALRRRRFPYGPRRPPVLLALLALLGGCGRPPGPAPPTPAPLPLSADDRVAVVEDPESTVLAAAVTVPGSAWELPGTEGLTLLSAMTLLEEMAPTLDELGARTAVHCDPAAFTFTLVAARDVWAPALDRFLDGLFRPAPSRASLERARARLAASLELDRASPAWQARLAVRRALHDDTLSSGWLGPPCGVPETLGFFDLADIRAAAHRFAPRLAHAAAILPAVGDSVGRALRRRLAGSEPPPLPAPRTVTAERRYVERNIVTAWVAAAFPFGPDADVEAIRLLGAVLEDAIAPGVERPESFTARYGIERHGNGGALVVSVVTTPDAAAEYARRIETLAEDVARRGVPAPVYERVLRRHRGRRLLELAAPEARAAAMALELALGRTPEPWPDLNVSAGRLRAAAASLGPPARSVVGPRSARQATAP